MVSISDMELQNIIITSTYFAVEESTTAQTS